MNDFRTVCKLGDVPENGSKVVEIGGHSVLLCNSMGELYAIENRCTHQNTPLTEGRIRRGYISCPLHGVRFNLRTGEPMGQLTRVPVRTHVVRIEDGWILLQLPDSPS